MKRLLVLSVFIFIVGFIIGCEETETPVEVEFTENLEILQPVAKLIESIPPAGSTVNFGDEITLEFTEVPENLEISPHSILHHGQSIFGLSFFIRELHYNGNKTPKFKIISNIGDGGLSQLVHDIEIRIRWAHGNLLINYSVAPTQQ